MEEKQSGFEAFYDFEKFLYPFWIKCLRKAEQLLGVQLTRGEIQKKKVEKSKSQYCKITLS